MAWHIKDNKIRLVSFQIYSIFLKRDLLLNKLFIVTKQFQKSFW